MESVNAPWRNKSSSDPLWMLLRRPPAYTINFNNFKAPVYLEEFWTSKQRRGCSIHEISYRACFKPQLPSFFIRLLTDPGSLVFDPFSGRGTTVIEAGLLGRRVASNDINPLSRILVYPRLCPPERTELSERLSRIEVSYDLESDIDLSMFFQRKTLSEILSLRHYLFERAKRREEDEIDSWIRMVATNRLTGHSRGFFSVYTLPPNQAVSPESQVRINERLNQQPEYKDVKEIIMRKSASLLRNLSSNDRQNLRLACSCAKFTSLEADCVPELEANSVDLTVTSPPFLNVVQYAQDNWLRLWFNHIDQKEVSQKISNIGTLSKWRSKMESALRELYRVTKPGSWLAFEVGEVRKNKVKLEETIGPLGVEVGFHCVGIFINSQTFTKTANIWGVNNNEAGTNSNRIVLFQKIR